MNRGGWQLIIPGLLLAAAAALFYGSDSIDFAGFVESLDRVPRGLLLLLLLLAPLAAVPLSALLIVVGANFPLAAGFVIVFAVLSLHHLLVYSLSRTRVSAWMCEKLAERRLLPKDRHARRLGDDLLFIFAATWVPGLSYIFTVALTALAGIPFRTYLVGGVLSQTLAATPYLVLGKVAQTGAFVWVGVIAFLSVGLAWWIKRLLGRRDALPGPDAGTAKEDELR